ncbi:diguanylate cyclase [Inmirania thermothiophila]|uniref:diguanylate cyclase n=1 Tax=Inmirania thermothiophila TaxID=1750597 RepID=A0A3N1Y0L4_9GAMM|nr:diguanylate cyclase [Inmirania thermothiophila]ROR32048.1 PAS domain S-box-containing protein/diguanylate cyclase (GGDEF)-like protein [Inmirania thermothiophila]
MLNRIGHKILLMVGIVATLGLVSTTYYLTLNEERNIIRQNEATVRKLAESVIQALQTVMLAGYADVAQTFADNLKRVSDVADFRILRTSGIEAFRDNETIRAVNRRRGEEEFPPHETEAVVRVLPAEHSALQEALRTKEMVAYYEWDSSGQRYLTFLAPIRNQNRCHRCHGGDHEVRGLLKLTTSMAPVEQAVRETWQRGLVLMALAVALVLATTGLLIRRSVVRPITEVTDAMVHVAEGDLTRRVPVVSDDELGRMASSFNRMIQRVLKSYTGLQQEQDKLTTIILSAREGIVVTDRTGQVVLVNPAAETLVGKDMRRIAAEGFLNLFDDPEAMVEWLSRDHADEPVVLHRGGRVLSVHVATIRTRKDQVVGSAALIRDITKEKQLEEELRRASVTDPLTGLYNRRHLDETLAREYRRAERYELPLSVVMFDVDHFKRFNDEHGHEQGDRVLQAIAEVTRRAVRNTDIPCRYGGEEFLVILPSTPLDGAAHLAERLREEVERTPVDGLRVTISVGVAALPEHRGQGPDDLVEAADAALYRAKQAGRNRVCRAA